jgi:hypothetical protein
MPTYTRQILKDNHRLQERHPPLVAKALVLAGPRLLAARLIAAKRVSFGHPAHS